MSGRQVSISDEDVTIVRVDYHVIQPRKGFAALRALDFHQHLSVSRDSRNVLPMDLQVIGSTPLPSAVHMWSCESDEDAVRSREHTRPPGPHHIAVEIEFHDRVDGLVFWERTVIAREAATIERPRRSCRRRRWQWHGDCPYARPRGILAQSKSSR